MGTKHLAPVGVLLATTAFLGTPAYAETSGGRAGAGTLNPREAEPVGGSLLGRRGIVVSPGVKAPPRTAARSYVIADADTGEVLAAKDAHGRYLPASTMKALTALTLIPKLDKKQKIRPSRNAVNQEGSAVGLVTKPLYTVEDLFKALMLVSGNDCAMALAEANGGLATTLADMNAEARRLQAFDTVAKTPSGLDKPGQRSSAYDLALIARAGLANPDFRRYISIKTDKFPAPKGYYEIGNHNKLLWRYKGMIGVKNGWTSKAQGTFVGAAKRNGRTVIVSIMRHNGYFWDEVADLLDWGFANRGRVTPVGRLVDPLPATAASPTPVPTASTVPATPRPAAGARRPARDDGLPIGYYALGGGLVGGLVWLVLGLRRRFGG
ncbi:D-alanyl-D-alanine carboxypeptidase (penicillin-binding protein 5/6) [Streptosporangium becharense]|uniref:D-alanyl-D-alanine carboxypeptidase (Penicillin-binding protein 5/6) n=1 Tax=Streptosporangium becharense TaxID=1816182 RepID=A0A7W9IG40_9ACTN|nr:D-alanyl-D-alanine carboxypeptidase [Streptosporangium becharense]MBB2909585.1 D-alanyl-D-alanine carboxypeptidase (penicillin-binding protein 5/6) [Streptosporangium becharense]MBB5819459.1 D-alanyl-D-alanine carboxypeptidase (penicillin-binding protein 5/6) [Streptosporangium becharense]